MHSSNTADTRSEYRYPQGCEMDCDEFGKERQLTVLGVATSTLKKGLLPLSNMLFLFFAVFALCKGYGASIPTILNDVIDPRDPLQSGPAIVQTYKMRTRLDIVWSCVTTLFICTWVAIHPNIPPRDEGHIRSLWRRIKLMLWTLLVPELVLIWAYRQWDAAKYISEYFEGEHGNFWLFFCNLLRNYR